MKKLTDEQARAYIAGEIFDPSEYERQHILMLAKSAKSAKTALAETSPEFHGNLKKTVARYIENHRNTIHTAELGELVRVYNEIMEA